MIRRAVMFMVIMVANLWSHGLATHMYIGSQTFDVWQSYDPEFYNALLSNDSVGVMTRKFYYIGLILPDLIDPDAQRVVQSLITHLYENLPEDTTVVIEYTIQIRNLFMWIRIPLRITASIHMYRFSPLRIQEDTYNQVQQLMYFNGDFPNTNLTKLREMVEFAKSQGWSPVDKAMIYGAYMHVIHDLYAHMVLQPASFGYPYVVESDSAIDKGLLYFPEHYYELFTETYIPDWSFMGDLYAGYSFYGDSSFNGFYFFFPYSFFTRENWTGIYYQYDWQHFDYSPVEKFIAAAQRCGYAGPGLTQERLESYIHGWAILLYMSYGYNEPDSSFGGPFSHVNWNAKDILTFIARPFLDEFYVVIEDIEGDAGHLGDVIVDVVADFILWSGTIDMFIDPTSYARDWVLSNPLFLVQRITHLANGSELWNREWIYFLESVDGLDAAIGGVAGWQNDSIASPDLKKLRRELEYWEEHAQSPPPCRREFYEGEIERALNFADVYRQSVAQGDIYLNYEPWSLARKAGVLGGMWEVDPSGDYYHQPGVLDLNFMRGEDYVYTTQGISIEGSPTYLKLKYDLVTFGGTKVEIYGEENPEEPIVSAQLPGPSRKMGFLPFDAQDAINNSVDTVYFEVQTANRQHPNQFAPMFSSDYREIYNRHPEIYTNPYYDSLFVGGNPVRTENQNPIQHPEVYWPYILPLNPVLTALNTPSDVTIDVGDAYNRITLNWTDRSRYNSGYEIQRIDEDGNVRTITINDSNATQYVDYTVSPFHTYHYKIRAINSNGLTSNWVTNRVYNTPVFTNNTVNMQIFFLNGSRYLLALQETTGTIARYENSIVLYSSNDGLHWTIVDTVYEMHTDSLIQSFHFRFIPMYVSDKLSLVGIVAYDLSSENDTSETRAHIYGITNVDFVHHGTIIEREIFTSDGRIKFPTIFTGELGNSAKINFLFIPPNGPERYIYWAEYNLASFTTEILGSAEVHSLLGTTEVKGLSPLRIDGVEITQFPWGVVFISQGQPQHCRLIAFYGDDEEGVVVIDTAQGYGGVGSSNNRVVWVSEDGLKEAVIGGIADMIWVDRKELINSDISGDNTLSLDYSQNSYGDEIVGVAMRDTGSVSKFIVYTRAGGSTQWSLRNVEVNYEFPVIMNGQVAFADRYRGRDGVYQKYLTLYRINADTAVFKERAFKVREEVVIGPDISRTTVALIHNGDSNYIFFSRYGYVDYVKSDNALTGWSRDINICKGYDPVAVNTDSSFTVFYIRSDSLFARTYSNGFGEEYFITEMGQYSPGYAVSYDEGYYYVAFEEMVGQMTGDTLFTPQSWSLKTAVVTNDFNVVKVETLDHIENGLTPVNPYRFYGRKLSIGAFNGYRYVLAEKPNSGIKLFRDDSGAWESENVNIGNGPYGNLSIRVDDKTVYLTWSEAGEVYYRFLYAGDPGFISKAIDLSRGDNPDYGGKAIFWSDSTKLEKMSLALEDKPAELMVAGPEEISNAALTFYTVGGEYFQTSVYLSALLVRDGASNILEWNVYATGPIPEQVITLGDTIPTPKTIERSGFEEYSDEKGKSADVGDRLSYRITDLKPDEYYTLGLYIYHEEDDITEQFYIDGKPVKSEQIHKGKETYIEINIPEDMYEDDSTIILEVEKENGPVAVLNEIYVFGKPMASSGPMSEEEVMSIPKEYRVMWIRPNPVRGRGEIVLGIPEDGRVRVDVYDIEGRRVKEIFNGMVRKGYYRVEVRGLSSGMYFVVVRGDHGRAMKKMVVLQ